jgi:threonine/homoserine/homoserine lactone efflux protein
MTEAVLQGALMGLILSAFCGPIFFMIIDLGINSSVKAVFYLAFSVFVCDLLIIGILIVVTINLLPSKENLNVFYWIGGSILVYFGVRHLLRKPTIGNSDLAISKQDLRKVIIKGFAINLLNPNILLFWFGAITLALETYDNSKSLVGIHFTAGLLVSFSMDFLKGYSAFHLKQFIRPNLIKYLNVVSGIIIIGFGLKLIFFHSANAV